jgi:hypothetical protein
MGVQEYEAIEHRAFGCDCCEGGECGDEAALKELFKIALSRSFFAKRAREALAHFGLAVAA